MEDKEPIIVQIIPAEGWEAVFCLSLKEGHNETRTKPLACWGLIKPSEAYGPIVGIVMSDDGILPTIADDDEMFLGYRKCRT